VAESVADEETIGLLQKHQVDYAQGYCVGRPAPLNVALADSGWIAQARGVV
jgi:EAL domain-containing protein (putative c-di-GMP-specific phosphodiesterase class I)